MQMLSKSLYSDAIGSTVRECASNALDSHRRAGITDPIVVGLQQSGGSSSWEFTVEDFGIGLDAHDVESIISKYGKSTKRDSATELGMMGLGFKAILVAIAFVALGLLVARMKGGVGKTTNAANLGATYGIVGGLAYATYWLSICEGGGQLAQSWRSWASWRNGWKACWGWVCAEGLQNPALFAFGTKYCGNGRDLTGSGGFCGDSWHKCTGPACMGAGCRMSGRAWAAAVVGGAGAAWEVLSSGAAV